MELSWVMLGEYWDHVGPCWVIFRLSSALSWGRLELSIGHLRIILLAALEVVLVMIALVHVGLSWGHPRGCLRAVLSFPPRLQELGGD